MKTTDQWRKFARKTNDQLVLSGYKNFKREVRRGLRRTEQEYVTSEIQTILTTLVAFSKIIRRCIPNKSLSTKDYTKDKILVANESKQFFSSVGEEQLTN